MKVSERSFTPSSESATAATGESAPAQGSWSVIDRIRQNQQARNGITVFFARQVSPYVTVLCLNLGLSGNQVTAIWGLLNVANSYLIYLALLGYYLAVPLIFAMYFLGVVFDCSDGEVARCRNTASPLGGKLLDGIWHKATEYSLLIAYVAAAYRLTQAWWLFPLGLVLVTGDAMYSYCYERRLLIIRLYAKSQEFINPTTSDDVYTADEGWTDFSTRRKLNAFKGLIQYKSVYFLIALRAISVDLLLVGLVVLTAYKHYAWIKLLLRTLYSPPQLAAKE